jgi:hypothetical protein
VETEDMMAVVELSSAVTANQTLYTNARQLMFRPLKKVIAVIAQKATNLELIIALSEESIKRSLFSNCLI